MTTPDLAPKAPTKRQLTAEEKRARHQRRILGGVFMLLALAALGWDVVHLVNGLGLASFSGVMDVWVQAHPASLHSFETSVRGVVGNGLWSYLVSPLLNLPAFIILAVPGIYWLRAGRGDIKLREPSMLEIELTQQGLDPRKYARSRGIDLHR
jgi:hypothetical protein